MSWQTISHEVQILIIRYEIARVPLNGTNAANENPDAGLRDENLEPKILNARSL